MKIVFLGTPEFAVASLDALLHSHHEVVGVVTAPDAIGGRGKTQLIESAVKTYALKQGILIMQPEKLRNVQFIKTLEHLHADIFVVVAFRMLPEVVWNLPPLGTINLHGSLLPKYRGAAPIHWAVINGEHESGVTIFKLKHKIDTGDVLMQEKLSIGENETTGEVYQKLMTLGAKTLVKALDAIENHSILFKPQSNELASSAPKLFHEMCMLDPSSKALNLHNKIRGLSPKPTAWINYKNQKYFIYRSFLSDEKLPPKEPGTIFISKHKTYLQAADRSLEILEIQVEGKRKMSGVEFARGIQNKPDF